MSLLPDAVVAPVLAGQVAISVVATQSTSVALPAKLTPYNVLTVINTGTKDAFFLQGDQNVAALTTSLLIPAGAKLSFAAVGTYVAAIAGGTDTTRLVIYQGNGPV